MKIVTLDFETYYDDHYSLSKQTTEAYIRDPQFEVILVGYRIDDGPVSWYTGSMRDIKLHLHGLVNWSEYALLCHNTAFDGAILSWHFGIEPRYYLDTLSMARPITGAAGKNSLAALAQKFGLGEKGTEVIRAKGKRRCDFSDAELELYAAYCCNDTTLTYNLYHILAQWVPPKEQYVIDMLLRMFIDPVIQLDSALLKKHYEEVVTRKEALLEQVSAWCDKDTLMSNPQFAEILKRLNVDPPMKLSPAGLKRGEEIWTHAFARTDAGFKELLEHPDERVQAVAAARAGVRSTLEETRTTSMIGLALRGCLPILLNYYGAHTGRASGGDKMNLQNLPRGGTLRKALKPPHGHSIVAGDSSQIEARVVAYLAGQWDLVEAFANKEDVYSQMASKLYGVTVTAETDPDKRFVGKTVILGCGYGLGAIKLRSALAAAGVNISEQEAQRIIDVYRQVNSKIEALWKDADKAIRHMAAGYVYELGTLKLKCDADGVHLPNGMTIRYDGLRKTSDGWEYQSRSGPTKLYGGKLIENVVQALARIIVFDQLCAVQQKLRPMDNQHLGQRYRVALTVHDEGVLVVPTHMTKFAMDLLTKAMSTPPKWASTLPVACKVKAGANYGECK